MVETKHEADLAAAPMVAVYRHDVHKLRGRSHAAAGDTYHDVPVNESVPLGADSDAALLSRPDGDPEQTVASHQSPYRLSLLTGETAATTNRIEAAADGGFRRLVASDDPAELHARWLTSDVPGAFNESVYYPYTSLQYHTLLTAALLEAYRAGHDFDELWLAATASDDLEADTRDASAAVASEAVTPHQTVLWTSAVTLVVTPSPDGRPAARLGAEPRRAFAGVWARLSDHPLDVDGDRRWRLLDAQLRRIRSWSAALAYIDEFVATYGPTGGERSRGHQRGDAA